MSIAPTLYIEKQVKYVICETFDTITCVCRGRVIACSGEHKISPITGLKRLVTRVIVSQRLPYYEFFGGVSGLTVKQFKQVNGFPNAFWGWGGEDDDLWNR